MTFLASEPNAVPVTEPEKFHNRIESSFVSGCLRARDLRITSLRCADPSSSEEDSDELVREE